MSDDTVIASEILTRLREGHEDALGELFAHYRERLKKIVHFRLDHRLNGRVSESDVLQETYVSATKRLAHYLSKSNMPLFVWFRLLVNQQLTDLHREHLQAEMRDARKEVSLNAPVVSPHTSLAMAAHLVAQLTSPSHAVQRAERIALLEEALNEMNELDREVIALRHFEELSNTEVAEVLGIGVHAASNRYVRAIKRMRELVSSIPGFDEI